MSNSNSACVLFVTGAGEIDEVVELVSSVRVDRVGSEESDVSAKGAGRISSSGGVGRAFSGVRECREVCLDLVSGSSDSRNVDKEPKLWDRKRGIVCGNNGGESPFLDCCSWCFVSSLLGSESEEPKTGGPGGGLRGERGGTGGGVPRDKVSVSSVEVISLYGWSGVEPDPKERLSRLGGRL